MSDSLLSENAVKQDGALPSSRPLPPPSRRRDKPQLSCISCRGRKLKCDRNQPCSNCSKRQQSCVYVSSGHSNGALRDASARSDSSADLQERIRRLEQIVQDIACRDDRQSRSHEDEQCSANPPRNDRSPPMYMRTGNANSTPIKESSLGDITDSIGRININETETSYVGPAHWQEVVNEISDIKDQLEVSSDKPGDNAGLNSTRPALLLGLTRHLSKQDILMSIPPKQTSDRLVSYYFEKMEMSMLAIHRPTFEREYATFWMDQSSMRPAWLAILFGMFSLATHFRIQCGSEVESALMLEEYRNIYTERAAHCLILADYTQPGQYTLEALLLYFVIEHAVGKAGPFRAALLFDIIVRSAMRMGYHRDPAHYPEISVFHGELRRRIWTLIRHMDIAVSSWVGLPKLVDSRQTDTKPPRNLLDHDINENMTELPLSRSEETPVSYATLKTDTLIMFANIVDEVTCINQPTYSRIMELDRGLHNFQASLPSDFQVSEQIMKSEPIRFLRRLMLNVIYQKARCVLHRSYIGSVHEEYYYSRYSCVDAAMRIITDISMSYDGAKPGGPLYSFAWSLPAAFTNDLLLASMIICVDLERIGREIRENGRPSGDGLEWTKTQMTNALRQAHEILQRLSFGSSEVSQATKIINIVLEKATGTVQPPENDHVSHYLNRDAPQYTNGHDTMNSMGSVSSTEFRNEPFISDPLAQPYIDVSSVEDSAPVDNIGEFFAAAMMDPLQFMMEVPLDIGSGLWTATASNNLDVLPDTPWNFDGDF